jgi:protein O-GlcNAc transferase
MMPPTVERMMRLPIIRRSVYESRNMLKKCGNREEAAACYERVIDLNPNSPEANVLGDQSEWEQAAEIYDRAITLKPDFPEAHNNSATREKAWKPSSTIGAHWP